MSRVTTRRRERKSRDAKINCHSCKWQKWGSIVGWQEVNKDIGWARCWAALGQARGFCCTIGSGAKNFSMDANFRDAEVVNVADSVVKASLGMTLMAIEEMHSMLINHSATTAAR